MPLLIPLPPLHCVQSLMIPQVRTMIASLDLLESKVEETTRHVAAATLSSAEVDQLDMREQMRAKSKTQPRNARAPVLATMPLSNTRGRDKDVLQLNAEMYRAKAKVDRLTAKAESLWQLVRSGSTRKETGVAGMMKNLASCIAAPFGASSAGPSSSEGTTATGRYAQPEI